MRGFFPVECCSDLVWRLMAPTMVAGAAGTVLACPMHTLPPSGFLAFLTDATTPCDSESPELY
ncbi:hypothetical protein C8Q73DRAFT_676381 [Cubamyces lactineus]|nr:hypothetical protein C8Q73DRAFT_676381 [Cubamyces lactineus]